MILNCMISDLIIYSGEYPEGGVLFVKTPTSLENFFNLLGFIEKKPQTPNKMFFVNTKNRPPPVKNFWIRSCQDQTHETESTSN